MHHIRGLNAPTKADEAANKGYVDLKAYPVGAIYLSADSTSPASLFGGTWEQLKDRFLLGAGNSYSAGDTGGEVTHFLKSSELPGTIPFYFGDASGSGEGNIMNTAALLHGNNRGIITMAVPGGGNAHNNMPPYLAVYMWQRVA